MFLFRNSHRSCDLAFILPENIKAEALANLFTEIGGEKLEAVNLFDVYQGGNIPNGYRSLAFALTFRLRTGLYKMKMSIQLWKRSLRLPPNVSAHNCGANS